MAEDSSSPGEWRSAPGGGPGGERAITRAESRWLLIMVGMLAVMMTIVVGTSVVHALHPPSNIEPIDPSTVHLAGEFVEANLGSALERDGSVTVRVIAQQYSFVPDCLTVPARTAVKFRLTSPDVIHGFMIAETNVNSMVVPGFIAEVRTRFETPGEYLVPCHEFCGLGHHAMWARITVVPPDQFPRLTPAQRTSCAPL